VIFGNDLIGREQQLGLRLGRTVGRCSITVGGKPVVKRSAPVARYHGGEGGGSDVKRRLPQGRRRSTNPGTGRLGGAGLKLELMVSTSHARAGHHEHPEQPCARPSGLQ